MYSIRPYFQNNNVTPAPIMYNLPNYHNTSQNTDVEKDDNVHIDVTSIDEVSIDQNVDLQDTTKPENSPKIIKSHNVNMQGSSSQNIDPQSSSSKKINLQSSSSESADNLKLRLKLIEAQKETFEKLTNVIEQFGKVLDKADGKRAASNANSSPDKKVLHTKKSKNPIDEAVSSPPKTTQKFMFQSKSFEIPMWKLFEKVGKKMNAKFAYKPDGDKCIVEYEVECDYPIDANNLQDNMDVCKTLGHIFKIFDRYNAKTVALTDMWLSFITEMQDERLQKSNLIRQLSRHLSTNDFLCEPNTIGMIDLVIRSLFRKPKNENVLAKWHEVAVPNNVQLWVKRVDESIACMQ